MVGVVLHQASSPCHGLVWSGISDLDQLLPMPPVCFDIEILHRIESMKLCPAAKARWYAASAMQYSHLRLPIHLGYS